MKAFIAVRMLLVLVVHLILNQENVAVLECFLDLVLALAFALVWITNFIDNYEIGCRKRIVMPFDLKRLINALEPVFDGNHVAFGVRIEGVKAVLVPIFTSFHRHVLRLTISHLEFSKFNSLCAVLPVLYDKFHLAYLGVFLQRVESSVSISDSSCNSEAIIVAE